MPRECPAGCGPLRRVPAEERPGYEDLGPFGEERKCDQCGFSFALTRALAEQLREEAERRMGARGDDGR